jgi:Flp pilus assembly protein TadG
VELALVLPVLVLLLAGVFDLCVYMSRCHLVSRAARDGARVGSTVYEEGTPTGDAIEAAAVAHARAVLDEVTMGCPDGVCDVVADWAPDGDWSYLTVEVRYAYVPLFGLTGVRHDTQAVFSMMTAQQ